MSTVIQQVSADLMVTSKAIVAAREERRMFTLWTLYQALKLLERHAILNQRCENWVEVINHYRWSNNGLSEAKWRCGWNLCPSFSADFQVF